MRIGRTLPPAAAPIPVGNIIRALFACFCKSDQGTARFEEELNDFFGCKYCFLVSSGKAALVLILKALRNLYPGRDEVLIPAFTCYSVPAAIKKAGLRVRLCDTGKNSLDFDKEQLRSIFEAEKTEKKILCVLVTHLFGCPSDFSGIKKIVGEKVPIVEDAAQAMGEEIGDNKIGRLGDVGFFSLGRGKALSTMEGGVILSDRDDLSTKLAWLIKDLDAYSTVDKIKLAAKSILTSVLQRPYLFWLPKSLPFLHLGETIYTENFPIYRMSSLQRNLALNWQKRLKGHQKVRRKNINFWRECLPQNLSLICSRQNTASMIRLPVLVRTAKERAGFCMGSEKIGCGIMPAYPTPINEVPQISEEFVGENYPNAKQLAECLMTIPVHEYVQKNDWMRIQNLLNVENAKSQNQHTH